MTDLQGNGAIAELARQQSLESRAKVYAVDKDGLDAVYIDGEMFRWAYIDDWEIIYADSEAGRWQQILHGTAH